VNIENRRFVVKRIVLMLVLVCEFGGWPIRAQDREMRTIAGTFATALAKLGKKSVAVVDFTDLRGNVTELGRYLAEQMSVALALTDQGIEVVDRTHLKAIVQENKLSASGLIDPGTALKLGRLAGVQVLVTGTLTPFGDSVQLAIKALDATTARIIAASTTDVAKTKAIEDLLSRDITSESSGAATGGRGTTVTSGVSGARALVKELEEIAFVVSSCRLVGDSINCSLQITNNGKDRVVTLGGQTAETRFIDQSGREYAVDGLQLGINSCRRCNVASMLVNDVPMAGGLSFVNIPSPISIISLLEFRYRADGGRGWGTVQFRNVPVVAGSGRRQ
jgi:TolB-like protein